MKTIHSFLGFLFTIFFCNIILAQNAGINFYKNLNQLPYLFAEDEAFYLSSYDRTGGNDDGFRGTYSELYQDKNGEHVIFDAKKPGCIYNLWGTGPHRIADWGRIRFYFDGEKKARLQINADDLFSGLKKPFLFPLAYQTYVSSGGYAMCAPIPFAKSLKITTSKKPYFYNVFYHLYDNVAVKSWTKNIDYAPVISRFKSCGYDPKSIPADSVVRKVVKLAKNSRSRENTKATLLQLNHGGCILSVKINPLYSPDSFNLNHIRIKISYDQHSKPDIDVPLGPFFGSGLGEADVSGLFLGMSSAGAYYCFFPMPFKKGIKIELENSGYDSGGEIFTEIGFTKKYPAKIAGAEIGYLGAKYNKAWPATGRDDYQLFKYAGKGTVVGQVMTVEPVKADLKQWWEGDMRIFIDDSVQVRFHGTGHEDEYQGGWSNFWMSNPYSLPLFGLPKANGLKNIGGQLNGSVTVYRFWPGGIPFRKWIKISTEHGTENKKTANYSSLVFFYFLPEPQ